MSIRYWILVIACIAAWIEISAQCPSTGCTITISGPDPGSYTINVGQKICLTGTANFTGNITMAGGTFENCATATQSFNFNFNVGPQSTVTNHGSISSNSTISVVDADFYNHGKVTVLFSNNLNISGDSRFYNYDSIVGTNNIKTASTAYLYNEGTIIAPNQFHQNGMSVIDNFGDISGNDVSIKYNLLNSGQITSTGIFQSSDAGSITIDGGCMSTVSWINEKPLHGTNCGTIFVSGNSENRSTVTGSLAIVDATPPGSPPYVDVNTGTFGPGVLWSSCGCPGPTEICNDGTDNDLDGLVDCQDTVDCIPDTAGTITVSANPICANSSSQTYTIDPVSGASSYDWAVPTGATITSGQGSTSIIVDWTTKSGDICVRTYNGSCYSAFRCSSIVVINSPSSPTIFHD